MSSEPLISRLDLDLEQWRQDVQTFADSTQQELNEITDQLSAMLAGSKPIGLTNSLTQATDSSRSNSEETSDDRLSKLKQALANRIK